MILPFSKILLATDYMYATVKIDLKYRLSGDNEGYYKVMKCLIHLLNYGNCLL